MSLRFWNNGATVNVSTDNPLPVTMAGGDSGMQPTDITATAPATWDPGTSTIGVTTGTTAGTAAAGNDSRLVQGAAGAATVRQLGTGATQAAAGNHSHAGLMSGSAPSVADSTATDVPGLVADFNALLAVLRTRGVLAP
ncbi:head fiber protein [Streptomyces sp. NPDC005549]|uniref:head fiber protein n=1 Tax=Streptomyces sp. NPDC005549 TaxID=3154888 RepID=UPI0033A9C2B4